MKTIIREDVLQSDFIAIVDDKGNKITYKELAEEAKKRSEHMEERSLIFLLCDRQIETAEFIYEVLYLNRVPLLLAADIDQELLDNLITIYQPQYIYCSKTWEGKEKYYHELELDSHVLLRTGKKKYPIHQDVALLLSTSGTTGSPKLVKLSYDNLRNNAEQVDLLLDIQCGQKGICPLSLNYVYGLTFCIWHWHCGATLLITEESILSNKFSAFYEREKANNFAGTPHIYQMLQRVQFWNPEKLIYLHRAISGGSHMSENDLRQMVSLMKDKFWVMYGQTESTAAILGMNFDGNNIKPGTVGKVFADIEAELDDITNELILKSTTVSMGYANNIAQLADGDINQGILYTGDVAYIDEDGCIFLQGRLARYIKILGKRVNLDDLERYLGNKFSDGEFACIGLDDSITIFYSNMKDNINQEILLLLDRRMKIPKKFISCLSLEELPRNSSGKIMYAKLEKLKNERENTGDL